MVTRGTLGAESPRTSLDRILYETCVRLCRGKRGGGPSLLSRRISPSLLSPPGGGRNGLPRVRPAGWLRTAKPHHLKQEPKPSLHAYARDSSQARSVMSRIARTRDHRRGPALQSSRRTRHKSGVMPRGGLGLTVVVGLASRTTAAGEPPGKAMLPAG